HDIATVDIEMTGCYEVALAIDPPRLPDSIDFTDLPPQNNSIVLRTQIRICVLVPMIQVELSVFVASECTESVVAMVGMRNGRMFAGHTLPTLNCCRLLIGLGTSSLPHANLVPPKWFPSFLTHLTSLLDLDHLVDLAHLVPCLQIVSQVQHHYRVAEYIGNS